MKKLVLLILAVACYTNSQAQNKIGPIQRKMLDTLCNCMSKVDLTKIKTPDDAEEVFTNCFNDHLDLLVDVAQELGMNNITENDASTKVGEIIGQSLLQDKCPAFLKLAGIMAKSKDKDVKDTETTTGTLKRMDLKGFNYLVLTDAAGSERSFIWLRQFPGSEKFMGPITKFVGKKLKITWQEMEVYLPAAKGYYKVKEIVGVEIL
ncbi:hypothetical protein ACFQZI_09815 [Mucilaginibacter lutimaris]|uniref:Uncharacterized protein n=1 Tax=Mucilaginibacter lutimaris TaxID=931629 RepID=A0ABW2ZG19_9SPHI